MTLIYYRRQNINFHIENYHILCECDGKNLKYFFFCNSIFCYGFSYFRLNFYYISFKLKYFVCRTISTGGISINKDRMWNKYGVKCSERCDGASRNSETLLSVTELFYTYFYCFPGGHSRCE